MGKNFSRAFQSGMKLGMYVIPWRMPETLEGPGAIKRLPVLMRNNNTKKAFIVTDKTLIGLGLLDSLFEAMKLVGVEYVVFDDVTPNPTDTCVEQGVK